MMRRALASLIVLSGVATNCTPATGGTVVGPGTYRDPAGWTIQVPEGWTATHFALSKPIASAESVQISNLGVLPSPTPDVLPLQTSSEDVPRSGIAVVVAPTDASSPGKARIYTPPLSIRDMDVGSGLGAVLDTMWFRGDGRTFVLAAKISDGSYGRPYTALAELIRSLRFE